MIYCVFGCLRSEEWYRAQICANVLLHKLFTNYPRNDIHRRVIMVMHIKYGATRLSTLSWLDVAWQALLPNDVGQVTKTYPYLLVNTNEHGSHVHAHTLCMHERMTVSVGWSRGGMSREVLGGTRQRRILFVVILLFRIISVLPNMPCHSQTNAQRSYKFPIEI